MGNRKQKKVTNQPANSIKVDPLASASSDMLTPSSAASNMETYSIIVVLCNRLMMFFFLYFEKKVFCQIVEGHRKHGVVGGFGVFDCCFGLSAIGGLQSISNCHWSAAS